MARADPDKLTNMNCALSYRYLIKGNVFRNNEKKILNNTACSLAVDCDSTPGTYPRRGYFLVLENQTRNSVTKES